MNKKNKIRIMDVKQALRDPRFRESLGSEFSDDLHKYMKNPGCGCHGDIYRRILKEGKKQLIDYFPSKEWTDPEDELKKLSENHWMVINCHVDDLENKLKKLPPGRKQLAVTRFEDQVTVVVNELDILY